MDADNHVKTSRFMSPKKQHSIVIVDGKPVVNMCPQHEGQLALVDLNTLQRLTQNLPLVPLADIKEKLWHRISDSPTIKDLVKVLADELAFHITVNVIKEIKQSDIDEEAGSIAATN